MTLKQTVLHPQHIAASAKMVDFGGWDMPLNYGSQIEEHHIVRKNCGLFDVSHMQVIDIKGVNSRQFLRSLIANNVDKLRVSGKALYSCMLKEDGGVIDDLIVYFMNEQWFRMVVNAGTAEKDLAWIQQHACEDITIQPRRDLAIIAIQGPQAFSITWSTIAQSQAATETLAPFNAVELNTPDLGELFIARTGYTGELGFEIILPATQAATLWSQLYAQGAKPCGLGARDTLRLEAGMNLYGQDMNESTTPLESGLAWTVDLTSERDFIGKTALQQQNIQQQLFGLVLLDKGVLRNHQAVQTVYGTGEITSGSFAPTLGTSIALARLPKQVKIGEHVQVQVRDKMLAAKVVKYPFVRQGKALI